MYNKLQSQLLLESTLENLENHQLSPTPDNYRLWFEYAAGTIDQLNAEVDAIVSQQQSISQSICQQLYSKHLGNKDQTELDETRIAIANMLSVMSGHLKDWDSSTGHFCDTLDGCINHLNDNPSLQQIKEIVGSVTEQAKKVRDSNLSIKTTLNNLSHEISALRQDVNRLGNEATTDALTETINRRGFDLHLKDIIEKSTKEGFDCALIVVDADNFKNINDNFGHQVGDKILKYIAATFRKNIRGGDILARYGGEEFAIILPHTQYRGAMQVAENLRQAISARQLTTGSNGKIIGRITVSIGVASYLPGESADDFFERTDKYMYQAKNNGKNQVIGVPNP